MLRLKLLGHRVDLHDAQRHSQNMKEIFTSLYFSTNPLAILKVANTKDQQAMPLNRTLLFTIYCFYFFNEPIKGTYSFPGKYNSSSTQFFLLGLKIHFVNIVQEKK